MPVVRLLIIAACLTLICATFAAAVDGMSAVKSPYAVEETMQRLEQQVLQRGLTVFAKIDHAANAQKSGHDLRPTQLLIFGNPKMGGVFMQCAQTSAIDLPLKALVWLDQDNQVWLGYNNPTFIAQRHGGDKCVIVGKMTKALAAISAAVVAVSN